MVRRADRAVGTIANGRAIPRRAHPGRGWAYIARPASPPQRPMRWKGYKSMSTSSGAEDIIYSNLFTGARQLPEPSVWRRHGPGKTCRRRIRQDELWHRRLGERAKPKAWKKSWGSARRPQHRERWCPRPSSDRGFKKEYAEALDPAL